MSRFARGILSLACLAAALAVSAQTPDRAAEVARLKKAAEAKTKQIGELARKGQLPTSDEALKLLQQMVDELKTIREQLRRLEGDAAPVPPSESRFHWGGFGQFQYSDTDRKGSNQFDAFQFRRLRLVLDDAIAPRFSARVSFDLAAGTNTNSLALRDAIFAWDASGGSRLGRDLLWAGQFAVPVGYELERSELEREFPERSQFNSLLFATERSRGLEYRRTDGRWLLRAGGFDALTIGDPEQANTAPGPGDRLAATVGARYSPSKDTAVGLSGFAGERPAYTVGANSSPKTARRFLYVDGRLGGLLNGKLTFLGEGMVGHDRVPSATANPALDGNDLAGYSLVGVFGLSMRDRLAFRWEGFDPDVDSGGNALHGLGLAYLRDLTPNVRFTLAHEAFVDESRRISFGQTRYGQTIMRLQVRF
jgi:hypothetical protein